MARGISEHFKAIIRVTRICSDICGVDVYDHTYYINWRTRMTFLVLNMSLIFLGYTGCTGYLAEGDWSYILQMLSIGGGTLIQGYFKYLSMIMNQAKIRFLQDDLHSIYEEYELRHSDYRVCLNKGVKLLSNMMKICAFINILMVIGLGVVTLFYSVITKTRTLAVFGEVPGVDPYATNKNFALTVLIQLGFIGVGGFGLYASDMGILTPITQIITMKDLIKCKFHDLNEILADEPDNHQKSMDALKDIIIFHQRYLRFVYITQYSSYWVILVQMGTYCIALVSTLFCIFLGAWPGGYVYLIYCFVMMYVYCGLGTLIEISNDGLTNAFYNDVRWYDLSIPEKKLLRMMLMMAQNTKGLTIGSVMPLSMNTGLQVTKTIYSITMMLFNLIE